MSLGPWQIIVVAVLVILLFGRGKISELMGDVAKGITSFRKGLKDGEHELKQVSQEPPEPASAEPVPNDEKTQA